MIEKSSRSLPETALGNLMGLLPLSVNSGFVTTEVMIGFLMTSNMYEF